MIPRAAIGTRQTSVERLPKWRAARNIGSGVERKPARASYPKREACHYATSIKVLLQSELPYESRGGRQQLDKRDLLAASGASYSASAVVSAGNSAADYFPTVFHIYIFLSLLPRWSTIVQDDSALRCVSHRMYSESSAATSTTRRTSIKESHL